MSRFEAAVLQLAARQHGVVRRDQALACGLTPRQVWRRLACGAWQLVFPGVYRVQGTPRTWRQQLEAASLWAARGFAVSHRSAAALWGFSRYGEGPVELTVARHVRAHGLTVVHAADAPLRSREVVRHEGLRVTSVPRTLLDLAAIEPEDAVRASVDQALTRRWTTLEALEAALAQAGGRRGTAFVAAMLAEYRGGEGPTESELETRVLELFEVEGLPRPERQRQVVVGGRLRRLDFRVPGTQVVIEADGYAAHSSHLAFERDRERGNALAARGFVVLHWTWAALRDRPDELVLQLRRTVERNAPGAGR